jgi:cell division cycle 20, cofactor of APC complex
MNMAVSQFNLETAATSKVMNADEIAYQKTMAEACGFSSDALNSRILSYAVEPPAAQRHKLPTTFKHNKVHKKTARRIPIVPEKILDAPGLANDFYLNLLAWSSRNILAVGLENSVYIWNADSGKVVEFCRTPTDDEYVSSVSWAADGSYLAVGTSSGTCTNPGDSQIWDVDSFTKIRSMKGHTARVGVLSWDKHIVSSGYVNFDTGVAMAVFITMYVNFDTGCANRTA